MRLAATLTASLLVATPVVAQQTVDVDLYSASFSPKNVTVDVGDTVRWNWQVGFHNVVSGVGGNPNGSFNSGFAVFPPTAPYEVTFDQAFLSANPVANNRYDYYCEVHLPGMTGSVTVQVPAGQITPIGSGVNAPGSMRVASGSAGIGQSLTVEIENVVDVAAGPGLGLLFFSTLPDPAYPAGGTLLPGFGLGAGAAGELLVSIVPPNPAATVGPKTWVPGSPIQFLLPIPNDPNLVGQAIYGQGALIDPSVPNGIGLTNGLEIIFG